MTIEEVDCSNNTCALELEELIPDDAVCVSVKVNINDDYTAESEEYPPSYVSVKSYLQDSGVDILAQSVGIHINGRKAIPHLHYHFVAKSFTPPTNPSQHRKRWSSKQDEGFAFDLDGVSFKYQKIKQGHPKFQFLSYPLKEGLYPKLRYSKLQQINGKPMPRNMFNFLLEVGKTIYETHCALVLRQEKTAERKQLALNELYDVVKDKNFNSYKEMMIWLEEHYIAKLSLDEKPDPKNYKTNCQKIGSTLGIWKYYDF